MKKLKKKNNSDLMKFTLRYKSIYGSLPLDLLEEIDSRGIDLKHLI